MKRILPILFALGFFGLLAWTVSSVVSRRMDAQNEAFYEQADTLIRALQQYRTFVGSFPSGTHADITKALSGQTDSDTKVLLIADSMKNRNNRGQILDPWGHPMQIFFTHDAVLIRSAGPNGTFENVAPLGGDDLIRSDAQ